jgi:hypothetical protein
MKQPAKGANHRPAGDRPIKDDAPIVSADQ